MKTREEQLAEITNGKPEWYATKKARSTGERKAGVVWDGNKNEYVPAPIGERVNVNGSWAHRIHGQHKAAMLTSAECEAAGLTPGEMNK